MKCITKTLITLLLLTGLCFSQDDKPITASIHFGGAINPVLLANNSDEANKIYEEAAMGPLFGIGIDYRINNWFTLGTQFIYSGSESSGEATSRGEGTVDIKSEESSKTYLLIASRNMMDGGFLIKAGLGYGTFENTTSISQGSNNLEMTAEAAAVTWLLGLGYKFAITESVSASFSFEYLNIMEAIYQKSEVAELEDEKLEDSAEILMLDITLGYSF